MMQTMAWLALALMALTLISSVVFVLAFLAVLRYLALPEPSDPPHWPRVSILKPVKGLDPAARAGFVSFIEQDYPDFEVIFAVEGQDDPVLPMIRELQQSYPNHEIKLVDSSPRTVEMGKANNVMAAQRVATGQVYVSADSDVIAGKDDLRRLVRALYSQPSGKPVAAAGAIPVYRDMQDFGAHLMGSYYSPFMILYYSMKEFFGVRDVFPGTYYAIKPEILAQVGGFGRVADNIADDSTMGKYLFAAGYQSIITKVHANIPEPKKSFLEFWAHQHRWHLTYRTTISLLEYFILPLMHPFLAALSLPFLLPFAGISAGVGWLILIVYMSLRWVGVGIINLIYFQEPAMWRSMWYLPLTEILLLGTWIRALIQTTTSWRGRVYRVSQGGKLVRLKE
jgi:ceramide glucosyltransferase